MNRIIKFKAKDLIGKWHYGNYILNSCTNTHYIDKVVIDSKTVCQFTGLYDIKGNEIYEHDILSTTCNQLIETGALFLVVFNKTEFICKPFRIPQPPQQTLINLSFCIDYPPEVINNIYDLQITDKLRALYS